MSVATLFDDVVWNCEIPSYFQTVNSGGSSDFIWKGGENYQEVIRYSDVDPLDYSSKIFVHVNHPDISEWISEGSSVQDINTNIVPKYVRNSILANIAKSNLGYNLQTAVFNVGDQYSKIGFSENDKYLIGPRSVGSYLFLNPNNYSDIVVDGSESISLKKISFGTSNAISIPVTFQYRMTDYFGAGDQGLGNIGGIPSAGANTNIEYTKTIGIDIYSNPVDKERFSFDLEVSSRYYSKSLISKDIPTRTFESALDDLNNTLKIITPRTSRDIGQ